MIDYFSGFFICSNSSLMKAAVMPLPDFATSSGHFSASHTTFGPDVDDVVGIGDDVEVVLDDDDGIAFFHQPVEHIEQSLDVGEMETGGRFIENKDRLARVALSQFRSQFHALTLPSGERGG